MDSVDPQFQPVKFRCTEDLDQVTVGDGFQNVAGSAGLERLEKILFVVVHRQHQNPDPR